MLVKTITLLSLVSYVLAESTTSCLVYAPTRQEDPLQYNCFHPDGKVISTIPAGCEGDSTKICNFNDGGFGFSGLVPDRCDTAVGYCCGDYDGGIDTNVFIAACEAEGGVIEELELPTS